MGILVDLIIIMLIAICIGLGYKKGLIGVAFTILSFFLAILIAIVLYKPVAQYVIDNTQIDNDIQKAIEQNINIENYVETNKTNTNNSEVITNYITDYIKNVTVEAGSNVAAVISQNLATTIVKIGVALILFIVAKILLIFAKALGKVIAKIPIIKQFDKLGGTVYGILKGIIVVYVILLIISIIAPVFPELKILQYINESYLGKFMYNDNILLKIVFKK